MGLWLAAGVLILGGFWAMGLRRLHTRMAWAVREQHASEESGVEDSTSRAPPGTQRPGG